MDAPSNPTKPSTSASRPPRILLFAGETSGDAYAALVANHIKSLIPDAILEGGCGPAMQAAGITPLYTIENLAVMGLSEVITKIPELMGIRNRMVEHVQANPTNLAIFVDYPGFHVRLAKALKAQGVKTLYYISPKIWAYREKRIKKIIPAIDAMACIFDFEPDIYARYGFTNTRFVGHPIVDVSLGQDTKPLSLASPAIGLLPGSRRGEIKRMLPVMVDTIKQLRQTHPNLSATIGCAPNITDDEYRQYGADDSITLLRGNLHGLIQHGDAFIAASGTVNLELGWHLKPAVIAHAMNPMTAFMLKRLATITHVSPVNIIAKQGIYPECLQEHCNAAAITKAITPLLTDTPQRQTMITQLQTAKSMMGNQGASRRVAEWVAELVKS